MSCFNTCIDLNGSNTKTGANSKYCSDDRNDINTISKPTKYLETIIEVISVYGKTFKYKGGIKLIILNLSIC